jgi:hypothetical protein
MKTHVLMIVYAVIAAVTCLAMMFMPTYYLFIYGATADAQAELLLRYIGALYGGFAAMAWMARGVEIGATRDAITRGLAVANGLAAVVVVLFATSGLYNAVIWISFAVHAAFCALFFMPGRAVTPASAAA